MCELLDNYLKVCKYDFVIILDLHNPDFEMI